MTTGEWSPEGEANTTAIEIKQEWLEQFIEYSIQDQLGQISSLISQKNQEIMAGLMQLNLSNWEPAIQSYTNEQIIHLIRFFTIAEMKLIGWESGDKSPVIWIAKVLKSRGNRIEKDLLLWIRENSSNRFLPHGSIL